MGFVCVLVSLIGLLSCFLTVLRSVYTTLNELTPIQQPSDNRHHAFWCFLILALKAHDRADAFNRNQPDKPSQEERDRK